MSKQNSKVFIIAEAGVNHNGNRDLACRLIDSAKDAQADAIKFQAFTARKLVTFNAEKAHYQKINTRESNISQYEMLKKLELSRDDFIFLKKYADQKGIIFLATPFDTDSVDFLEPLVDRYKISSGDCVNFPFLTYVAKKGKPIIVSTGMTTLDDVQKAIRTLKEYCEDITLLHCTTNYPCPYEEVNLRAIKTLQKHFNLPVGYSDHTAGIEVSIAATALGATVIEKHCTLDKNLEGPDHKASLEPHELKMMVEAIRNIEKAMGDGVKKLEKGEIENKTVAQRSLVFSSSLKAGTILSESNVVIKRPGKGLPPEVFDDVIGKRLKYDVEADDLVSWELLEK